MSTLVSLDEILRYHDMVVTESGAEPGTINMGLVQEIAKKPDLKIGGEEQYPTIFVKAATVVESMIRLHPFIDGNKRTSLMVMWKYLWYNDYFITIFPLSAVRRTVSIAMNTSQDPESVKELTIKTARWIEGLAIRKGKIGIVQNVRSLYEFFFLAILYMFRLRGTADKVLKKWYAYDIYIRNST